MRQSLDNALAVYVGGVKIPVLTLLIIALACLFIVWFRKTKLGQDMRAVGQDMNVARDAGINVDRTRLISIVMSTVFAGFGMIIYLQNIGNFPTYTAHTNVGMFGIAALLVGGASVDRASIGNVFLGVILFHTMFIVACLTTVIGDKLELTVEVMQQKGGSETTETYQMTLPHNIDGIIINLPAYMAGLPEEAYLEEFIPAPPTEEDDGKRPTPRTIWAWATSDNVLHTQPMRKHGLWAHRDLLALGRRICYTEWAARRLRPHGKGVSKWLF